MKNKTRNNKSILLFSSFIYVFISTMFHAYKKTNSFFYQPARKYIIMIMFVLMITKIIANFLKRKKQSNIMFWISLFVLYITISIILNLGLDTSSITNTIWWFVVFYLSYYTGEIKNKKLFDLIIIISVIFITMLYANNALPFWYGGDEGINAIYYPVCLMPCIFFIDNKYFKYALLGLLIIVTFFSSKSTALLMVVFGILSYYWVSTKDSNTTVLIKVFSIFIGILLVFMFIFFKDYLVSIGTDLTGNGRTAIWSSMFAHYRNFNLEQYLFGIGTNGVASLIGFSAHNDLFEVLFNYGIIGALLYIMMFVKLIIYAIKYKKNNCKYNNILVMSVIMSIIISMFSNVIFLPRYFIAFAFVWGYIIGINEKLKN